MDRLKQMAVALRTGFDNQFQTVGDVGLFLGLACNLAFVGQVYFWPVMWHTSALMLSYTDVTYVAELLCALALLLHLRREGTGPSPRVVWVMAALVQATLVLYCVMFKLNIPVPDAMNWACGAAFGVYVPLVMLTWLRVHARLRTTAVVWNVMLAAAFGSFIIWVFTGLEGVKVCMCMGVILLVATLVLTRRMRALEAGEPAAAPAGGAGGAPTTAAFRYPSSAVFLFSLAFILAISFASAGGEGASFSAGAFLAPLLFICVLVLLVNVEDFPLTNIAVPAIVTATIAAASFRVDPALSFDLAALGMFLFLAYAVVLLCASSQGDDRGTSLAFLKLMIAFSAGCIAGRVAMAACSLADGLSSDVLVIVSVLAANAAMIILMRRGMTVRRAEELFGAETAEEDLPAAQRTALDEIARARNLGEREKEVLALLLERKSASEIARALIIANGTAKSHIRHVYKKLDVHSRAELFAMFGLGDDDGR